MQTRWHPTTSDSTWLTEALAFIALAEREALTAHGEFHIVLAGGSTPRRVYEALAQEAHDWSRWHVWFGDERCLPVGHPQRNSEMANTALLHRIKMGAVHPIPAESGAHAAAEAYRQTLAGVPEFGLVILGLGEDGHTASLFPGHTVASESDAMTVFDAPKPPPERVSLSASRLSRARHVLFLVSGVGKLDALLRWRAGISIPAATIQPETGVDVLLTPDLSTSGVFS